MTVRTLTIDELERWVRHGAHWRLVAASDDEAVVDLCACTGELVERRRTDRPAVIAYVRRVSAPGSPCG